ncbi:MAG TPA: hypothetical protein VLK37_07905 [Solirubrobacterales bacterium]|nr:hypothetical protein [Solirubrobacterales bacterium]
MVVAFFQHEAYGNIDDYLAAVRARRGFEAAEAIRNEMRTMADRHTDSLRLDWQQAMLDASHTYGPIGFFLAIPEADFLAALEAGAEVLGKTKRAAAALHETVNDVCQRRGIPYRLTRAGRNVKFEWTGDATIAAAAVNPVLSAIDDPRLVNGVKVEFEGARDQLRRDTPESRKRAVGEACSAVESAMKVVLSEHGEPLPKPAVLSKLVDGLITARIVESEMRELLVAPGFFGNRKSRHGGGYVAHSVSTATAEAAVAASAVAITYLANQLPPN